MLFLLLIILFEHQAKAKLDLYSKRPHFNITFEARQKYCYDQHVRYGINPGKTWGNATEFVLDQWKLMECDKTFKCSKGPYLYIKVGRHGEGIGALMNSFKISLVLASHFNLTIIPSKRYFSSPQHKTNFMRTLGFELDTHCTEKDFRRPRRRINRRIIVLDQITPEITAFDRKMLLGETCSPANHGLVDKQDTGTVSLISSVLQMTSLQQYLPQLIIYIDTHQFFWGHEEDYLGCSRDLFAEFYRKRILYDIYTSRYTIRTINSMVNELIITWQLRYDDNATGDLHKTPHNAISFDDAYSTIEQLLYNSTSVLYNFPRQNLKMRFVSSGHPESVFNEIRTLFNGTVDMRINDPDITAFDLMAASDILITGPSSISRLAAAVNLEGMTLYQGYGQYGEYGGYKGIDNAIKIYKYQVDVWSNMIYHQLWKYQKLKLLSMTSCLSGDDSSSSYSTQKHEGHAALSYLALHH